jgi:radical SAM superfamily enzyme YgiQ (UPF0313 family)
MICLVSALTRFSQPDIGDNGDRPAELSFDRVPLGVLTLAAVMEQGGTPVSLIDLDQEQSAVIAAGAELGDLFSQTLDRMAEMPCEVFGFSSICSSYPFTLRLVSALKKRRPDVRIVLGGPQASVVDTATLEAFPAVDMIVRGEAERVLPAALDAMRTGRFEFLTGVTFRNGSRICRTPNAPVVLDLDSLPLPAFHLYAKVFRSAEVSLELGRGCPFACTFCSTNDFFRRKFRLKSPAVLLLQMEFYERQYGSTCFDLVHDMFTVDRKAVVAFCEAMIESGRGYTWNCSARTDCVDTALLKLMAEAGCRGIFFGIETGSERMQRIVQKNLDLDQARQAIETADTHGIRSTVSTITGFPDEQPDDFEHTAAFLANAARFPRTRLQLHLLAPLAGTPIESQYRPRLELDRTMSDISHVAPIVDEDWDLVAAHRDVFPNFYAVPLAHLDREYLIEARAFLLNGFGRLRWLCAALHQEQGGIIRVFDRWRAWKSSRMLVDLTLDIYYRTPRFDENLTRFAETEYAGSVSAAVASFYRRLFQEIVRHPERRDAPANRYVEETMWDHARPALAREVYIFPLNVRLAPIFDGLSKCECPAAVEEGPTYIAAKMTAGAVEVFELSPLSAEILLACDGQRTAQEIAASIDWGPELSGFPIDRLGMKAFERLSESGYITRETSDSHFELTEASHAGAAGISW